MSGCPQSKKGPRELVKLPGASTDEILLAGIVPSCRFSEPDSENHLSRTCKHALVHGTPEREGTPDAEAHDADLGGPRGNDIKHEEKKGNT